MHGTSAASLTDRTLHPAFARDFAAEYAAFVAELSLETLPIAAREAARVNLLDTLACATAGLSASGVCEVLDLVRSWGGAPQSAVLCTNDRLPAPSAAWVNGVMAHARDYDDTHDAAILHAGVSVVPAALAAADLRGGCTGAELITGIAAGLELVCRLGMATRIGIIEAGFIYSSLFGYFGATAAAAKVLGLSAEQTHNAIGIVFSQAAGTHQVTRDAALTKRMQPGFAARAALVSVELAQRNVRGAQAVFEGADGLFRIYLRDQFDPVALREGLGTRFHFADLSYKPFPCCRFNHTAIDAALAVRKQPGFRVDRIRRIRVGVANQAFEAVCTPREIRIAPKTIVQAQFSIPYNVACALLRGTVLLGDFTDAALHDPDVLALASRVECHVDAEIEREFGRTISPTHILVETEEGMFEARADVPRGHPDAPMSLADLDAKLRDCLAFGGVDWPEGTAERLTEAVGDIEHLADSRSLMALLTPGTSS